MVLIVFFSSCNTPKYLPDVKAIGLESHGSYIKINHKSSAQIHGELIAVENNNIYVLLNESKRCLKIPVAEIKNFKLRYAQPAHYGWSIPIFSAVSLVHGILATFTLPLNLIITTAVTISGENDFRYNQKSISLKNLKMFARFPQGIPENIDLASIK